MQAWHVPNQGFICFFTRHNRPAKRTIAFVTSGDGVTWSAWRKLAAFEEGRDQISAASPGKAATCFNYHPAGRGLNWRTNLHDMETADQGAAWRSADGPP